MALLTYQLNLGGLQAVQRGLRSIERRVAAINRAGKGGIMAGSGVGARGGAAGASQAAAAQRTLNQRMALEEQRHQNKLRQIRERGNQTRIRDAERTARAEERIARRSGITMEQYKRRVHGAPTALRGGFGGRSGQGIRSGLRAVGTMGAGLLTIGGGFAIAGAIGQEKGLRASAAALANQARGTAGGQGKSFDQLQREAMDAARTEGIKSGQGPEAVIGAMRQFQAISGRFDIAQKYIGYMTEISDATDAGLGDVGRTAGQIFQSIAKGGMDAEEAMQATMDVMDAMAGQSKIGSIEMNDLAQNMGALMSATDSFGGEIGDLAAKLGAMSQVAVAGGAKSPAEAFTSIMRFADDLTQRGAVERGAFAKAGVDVFKTQMIGGKEVRTELKDPLELIKSIMLGTGGDLAKVQSMFGIRSAKVVKPFAKMYREAGGGEEGVAAIERKYKEFMDVTLTAPQRKEAATNRRRQADRQLDRARAEFNDAIGKELLPVLTQLIPRFTELIPALTKAISGLVKFASWFDKEIGIGVVIAAALTKDIAAAGIGSAVRNALVGGAGGVGGGGGAGGVGGGGGLALTAAILGLTAAMEQARKLAEESKEFKSEAQLERERMMAGMDVGKTTIRKRDFRDKLRDVFGGIGWESATADISKDWGEDEELLKKEVDKKGRARVTHRAYKPEETISVPMKEYRPPGERGFGLQSGMFGRAVAGVETGTGERVSPGEQAAMPVWETPGGRAAAAEFKAAAAALKEGAAALKESAAGLNRTDAPSPTTPR
jgi:hypothetical protein